MNACQQTSNAKQTVLRGFRIPAKPEILTKIQDITQQSSNPINEVAELIAADIGLSGSILKIINSPYYGMPRMISDVKQAVALLGIEVIKTLIMSHAIKTGYMDKACISLERLWDTATEVANAMLFLGNNIKNKIPLENLHAIGLFHDCGIPAFAIRYPDYKETLIEANASGEHSLLEIEEARYKTNHAIVGYFMVSAWNLPKDICSIILQHHETDFVKHIKGEEKQLMFAAFKAGENMMNRKRHLPEQPEWQAMKEQVLETLGLPELDYQPL